MGVLAAEPPALTTGKPPVTRWTLRPGARLRRGAHLVALLVGIGIVSLGGYLVWAGLGAAPRSAYRLLFAGLFALYMPACYLVARHGPALPKRATLLLILGIAVLGRALLVPTTPQLSDDIYRYVWDGRVQAAGLSPYAYAPAAPQVVALHPPGDAIWPGINRKPAITIYPPGAEWLFAGIYRLHPDSVAATKAVLVGLDLGTCLVVLALLRALGLPLVRVLIYAWAPLPIIEFGSSGHVEAAEVLLTALALLTGVWATRRRADPAAAPRHAPALLALACLAGAALVKLIPLLLLAAWLRRFGWKLVAWAGALFVLGYLAFVLVAGGTQPTFLVTYLRDEYVNAPLYLFLSQGIGAPLGLPDLAVRGALVVALGLIALWIAWLSEQTATAFIGKSFLLVAAYLALATSAHPWYATWLLLFLPLFLPPGGLPLLGPPQPAARRRPMARLVVLGAWAYTGLTIWGGYPGA